MGKSLRCSTPIYFGVLLLIVVSEAHTTTLNSDKGPALNVAVIGAGVSGLVSAKYSIAQGYNVTVYEQSEDLGGVWWYTDRIGKDQYGVNVHSAMYQGLRANLPHQLMEYPDFPYPSDTIPYPPQSQILHYLRSYADHFGVTKHIKFSHLVVGVAPIENGKWRVLVKDLPNNKYETSIHDIVFVANGHLSEPRYPNITGIEEFQGKYLHSHDFRTAESFRGEDVLIIGHGNSGVDLVALLSNVASRVTSSQHKRLNETIEELDKRISRLPPHTLLKENVKRFTLTGAEFIDGTHETFSTIIFATGYKYNFPFLDVESDITVEENHVQPLYKQVFNIEHPTMIFIGIPFTTGTTRLFDLQVRFAMKFITGEKNLPSKVEMLRDMHTRTKNHWKKGYRKHHTHYLGPEQQEYFDQLVEESGVENIPKVMVKIHVDSRANMLSAPSQFRKYKYTILDENSFVKEKYED